MNSLFDALPLVAICGMFAVFGIVASCERSVEAHKRQECIVALKDKPVAEIERLCK